MLFLEPSTLKKKFYWKDVFALLRTVLKISEFFKLKHPWFNLFLEAEIFKTFE